jgi:hypothetical protein
MKYTHRNCQMAHLKLCQTCCRNAEETKRSAPEHGTLSLKRKLEEHPHQTHHTLDRRPTSQGPDSTPRPNVYKLYILSSFSKFIDSGVQRKASVSEKHSVSFNNETNKRPPGYYMFPIRLRALSLRPPGTTCALSLTTALPVPLSGSKLVEEAMQISERN